MRKKPQFHSSGYRILVVDDEIGIIDSLAVVLKRNGYDFVGETDPIKAIEMIRKEHFDLLILDYFMHPCHGDYFVEQVRKFNKDLYILLLTGHRDLAPPLETLKTLDIQAYCEKGDKFDQLILLVESGIKSIMMRKTILSVQDGLNKILKAVPKIYQLQPLDSILEEILREIIPIVDSENAFILVDDVSGISEDPNSIFRGIGRYNIKVGDLMDMLDPDLMEHIGKSRMRNEVVMFEEGIILPLINEKKRSLGVIFVENLQQEMRHLQQGVKILEIYASQATSSLSNAYLHSMINMKNDELKATYSQLHRSYFDTIEALRQAVDAKDLFTRGHSDRVAYYAVLIGTEMELPESELELLKISGYFHDIGKIGTSDDLLVKSEKYSTEEYEEIKKHPLKGAEILSAVSVLKNTVPIVQSHHERFDGTGYPLGLKGEQIPLLSRIIAVADAFDAMTSDRHYRSRVDIDSARNQLVLGADKQFDGAVVDHFIHVLDQYDGMAGLMNAHSLHSLVTPSIS